VYARTHHKVSSERPRRASRSAVESSTSEAARGNTKKKSKPGPEVLSHVLMVLVVCVDDQMHRRLLRHRRLTKQTCLRQWWLPPSRKRRTCCAVCAHTHLFLACTVVKRNQRKRRRKRKQRQQRRERAYVAFNANITSMHVSLEADDHGGEVVLRLEPQRLVDQLLRCASACVSARGTCRNENNKCVCNEYETRRDLRVGSSRCAHLSAMHSEKHSC
jgi:hypothetical protein